MTIYFLHTAQEVFDTLENAKAFCEREDYNAGDITEMRCGSDGRFFSVAYEREYVAYVITSGRDIEEFRNSGSFKLTDAEIDAIIADCK